MANKLTLNLNPDNFSDFVEKLQDLTNISDVIKLKIDSDNILAYSMLANDVSVLSLKNYFLPTDEYITNFKSDKTFDYIITSASKFVKNLKFFNSKLPIELELNSKPSPDDEEIMHVRAARYSNGKLKISCIGAELSKIRDINKPSLDARLNIKNSKWGFKMSKSDFQDVKKLSNINSEDKIINVVVESGKVSMMEEYKWELEVDKIDDDKNKKITFNKKYLSNINDDYDFIDFKIFETFILVSDDNSNLMLSFETDFEGPDD
jgi:hypothetical protein